MAAGKEHLFIGRRNPSREDLLLTNMRAIRMAKKCILVGLDGANPAFVRYMIGKGELPNTQRIMREGILAPHCLSSLPTSTPEN